MKLVSACLLGIRCAWNGDDKYRKERALELSRVETLIPVCPEQLGGLATPRAPSRQGSAGGVSGTYPGGIRLRLRLRRQQTPGPEHGKPCFRQGA